MNVLSIELAVRTEVKGAVAAGVALKHNVDLAVR